MWHRLLRLCGTMVRLCTLAGLVLHFALTLVYVMPLNPMKMELGPLALHTIGAYFPQNWSLFAPNPVQSTQMLLVRCLRREEIPKPGGPLPVEGWENVSEAHFVQAQRHRLSAYERLVRPLQNSLRAYLNGGPDLEPYQMACTKGDADACKAIKAALEPRRMAASAMFRRIGSAFCREAFPDQKWAGVALRFRDREAVPWSKRKGGAPKVTDYELGVFSIDLAVALPGLYRASDE